MQIRKSYARYVGVINVRFDGEVDNVVLLGCDAV